MYGPGFVRPFTLSGGNQMKKGIFIKTVSLILAGLMLILSAGCVLPGKEEKEPENPLTVISSVSATGNPGTLIPVDSSFSIITNESVSEDYLKSMLALEPETGFTIEKKSDNNYKLIPDEPFEDSSLVRIKAVSGKKTAYEWSFETDGELRVIEAYPHKHADPDTGIEIKFSFMDLENFDECFSIEPEVEGKIVHNGKSRVFIPDEELPEGEYTVTVSGNLRTTQGKTLGKDYVFSFYSAEDYKNDIRIRYSGHGSNDSFRCNEVPKAVVSCQRDVEISVDLRKMDNDTFIGYIEAFLNENYYGFYNCEYDITDSVFEKLEKVDSFTLQPDQAQRSQNMGYDERYFSYPSVYPAGKYVAAFTTPEGFTSYHLFQVSDLSVYSLSVDDSITVWVNNSASGAPEAGCEVLFGDVKKETDKSGVAVFEIKGGKNEESRNDLLIINTADDSFVTCLSSVNQYDQTDYYTDLYMESTLYNPGDTVRVWGCILPRYGKKMPDKVLLNYEDDNYTEVKPDSNGCFTYSFVSTSAPGEYDHIELIAEADHKQIDCNWAGYSVFTYELPKATFTIEADKNAYFAGEDADITVTALAFDGTPQSNTRLVIDVFGDKYYKTTDENGKVALHAENVGGGRDEHYDFVEWDYIRVCLAEDEDTYTNDKYISRVLSSMDYYADAELDGNNTLKVKAYKVDLSEINSMAYIDDIDIYTDDSLYRAEPVDVSFTLKAEESYTKKVPKEEYYDFFSNLSKTDYEYDYVTDTVLSRSLSTSGGSAVIDLEPYRKNDGRISADLTFVENGITVTEYARSYYAGDETKYGFVHSIDVENEEGYNLGDTVRAKITDPEGNAPETVSALFITAAPDKRETFVTSSPEVSFEFDKNYKDGARIFAAFFDGEKVTGTLNSPIISKYDFGLDVSVKPDKESYAPGDEVTLDISVTDKDGNPVSCGGVTNVIDEALFTLAHDSPETELKEWNYFESNEYISTWSPDYKMNEYGGGDGGEQYRTDFEDTPFFETIATGKDGKTKVSFKLPDSVTSWHITVKAIDGEGRNGYVEINVPATLDYYLYTTGTDIFCAKDDICLAAKALSGVPEARGESTFNAVILDMNGTEKSETLTVKAGTGEYAPFNFGKLPEGRYKIRISAQNGEYRDGIEQEISVVSSRVTTGVVTEKKLDGSKLNLDTDYRADICLVDEKYEEYNNIINKLSSLVGSRFDMSVARSFARGWLAGEDHFELFCDGYWYESDDKDENRDIELMAKHYLVFPDSANSDYGGSFSGKFSDEEAGAFTREEQIMFCALLAMENEPVLSSLDKLNNEFDSLTDREKVWLGIAYAAAGQYEKAYKIFGNAYNLLETDNNGNVYYPDDDNYTSEYMTALISLLAFKINAPQGDKLIKTLMQSDYRYYLPAYELIAYVRSYIGDSVKTDSVDIKLGGETINAEFLSTERYHIYLTPAELKTAEFVCNGCSVNAICKYYSSVDTAAYEGKNGTPVEVYVPDRLEKGEMFNISFTVEANDKNNLISFDYVLPAGITCPGKYTLKSDSNYYGVSNRGCELDGRSFRVWLSGSDEYIITVPCKAAFAGDFVLESFAASEGSTVHLSPETNITIME